MCNMCFKIDKISTTTTFTVQYKDCIIVVKNVPCLECSVCGEILFSNDVSEKLEKIIEVAKKLLQEVAVIEVHLEGCTFS